MTYTALAAIVGLMLGIGLAFLIEMLEDRIRTRQDVQVKLGTKLLGTVTDMDTKGQDLVMTSLPGSQTAEDFRKLAINLRLESVNNPFSILLVTSPGPKEGKSTVLANLAMALARTGISVVAVDANLQSPGLHEVFGIQRRKGLTEAYTSGGTEVNLQPTRIENLKVLTSGSDMLIDSTELLNSPRLSDLLHKIASQANIVIVDSPPLTMADSRILASITDGAVVVLRSGHTQGAAAREAIETLRGTRVNLVGVILNGQPGTKRSILPGWLNLRALFKQPGETLARMFQRSR
jgi:capsular exopolysaccharide synthesis family protein